MKINLKVRLKNKTWLLSMASATVLFGYQICGLLGIVPTVTEDQVINMVGLFLNILVGLGIVVDPTTAGISDSNRAMSYVEPNRD